MDLTRRGRAAVACVLALAAGAWLLAAPALLLAAAGLTAWLLAVQLAFVAALARERSRLTVELATPGASPAVDDAATLHLRASGRGALPLTIDVDVPAAARRGTDSADRGRGPAGSTDESGAIATGAPTATGDSPTTATGDATTATRDTADGDTLAVSLGGDAGATGVLATVQSALDRSAPTRSTETSAVLEWPVAGRYGIGPARVAATDPLGLFAAEIDADASAEVVVRSRETDTTHLGHGGDRIAAFGEHNTGRRGPGTEPAELRPYEPGDDVGRIDWNATARLREAYVTESEAETDRRTVCFLDHRATTGVGSGSATPLAYLRYAALAIVESARELGDPLGCYAVGDEGVTVEHAPRATPGQYETVAESIRALRPTVGRSDPIDPDGSDPSAGTDTTPSTRNAAPKPGAAATTAGATGTTPGSAIGGAVGARGRTIPGVEPRPSTSGDPAEATALASRLTGDDSAFGATLAPLLEDATPYVRRVADEPLFAAARTYLGRLQGSVWSVILTDGARPAELRETVKLARRGNDRVLVVLAPEPLFRPGLGDLPGRRRAYEDVADFADSLAGMERVTVRELAPGDVAEVVLGAGGESL